MISTKRVKFKFYIENIEVFMLYFYIYKIDRAYLEKKRMYWFT